MVARILMCLGLVLLIALVAVCPLPAGHGPSSAVYGPATTFRAYRAAMQLQSALAALLVIFLSFASLRLALTELWPLAASCESEGLSLSRLSPILRC